MRSPRSKLRTALAALLLLVMLVSCAAADGIRMITAGLVGGTSDIDGVWHAARDAEGKLQIRWNAGEGDTYSTVLITLPDGQQISEIVYGAVFLYPEKDLPAGKYELAIRSYSDAGQTGYGLMKFVLEEGSDEQPQEETAQQTADETPDGQTETPADGQEAGETPESAAGGKPSGGFSGAGAKPSGGGVRMGGGTGGRGQTNAVTAGKALTSTHAQGSGSALPYGTVELTVGEEPMEILTVGGAELELTCGGALFTGEILEDVLILTSVDGESTWTVTLKTLKILNESGIREIRLTAGEEEILLETGLEFTGADYARERAQGYVSSDFLLCRQEGDWSVAVEDRVYELSDLTGNGQNGENV